MKKRSRLFLQLLCSGCMAFGSVTSSLTPVFALKTADQRSQEGTPVALPSLKKIALTVEEETASYGNGNGAAQAIDGDFNTIFDGYKNGYMIFDLGEEKNIAGIGYCPRTNQNGNQYAARTQGGMIAGSNDKEQWTLLYTIPEVPEQNTITQVRASQFNEGAATSYRYIKYYKEGDTGQDYEYANIAEFEVYEAGDVYALSDTYAWSKTASTLPVTVLANGETRTVSWDEVNTDGLLPFEKTNVTGTLDATQDLSAASITAAVRLYPSDLEYLINANAAADDALWTQAKELYPTLINSEAPDQSWNDDSGWGIVGEKTETDNESNGDYGITGDRTSDNPYEYGWWAGTKNSGDTVLEQSEVLKVKLTLPAGKHTIQVGTHGHWWGTDATRSQKAYWILEDGTEYELGDCGITEQSEQVFSFDIDLSTAQTGMLAFKKTGEKEPCVAWISVSGKYEGLDRSALQTLVDQVKDYQEADFSADSWQGFPDALEAANAALKTPLPTAEAITQAYESLSTEVGELKHLYTLTFKNGEDDFATITNAVEDDPISKYFPETDPKQPDRTFIRWDIADGATVDGSQVIQAKFSGDKTDLQKLFDDNLSRIPDGNLEGTEIPDTYTDDTYKSFKDAMKSAKDVLDKTDATDEEVSAAQTALQAAVNELKEAVVFRFSGEGVSENTHIKVEKGSSKGTWENQIQQPVLDDKTFAEWQPELPETAETNMEFTAVFGASNADRAPLKSMIDSGTFAWTNDLVSAEAKDSLKEALDRANEVYSNSKAKADDIETAMQALNTVMHQIVPSNYLINKQAGDISVLSNDDLSTPSSTSEGGSGTPYTNAFDKNENTFWHSKYENGAATAGDRNLFFDLNEPQDLYAISLLPRQLTQNTDCNGDIFKAEVFVGNEIDQMTSVGVFAFDHAGNSYLIAERGAKNMYFQPVNARYVNVVFKETGYNNLPENGSATLAEINFYAVSDKTELKAEIEKALKLQEAPYTAESWQTLQTELNNASEIVEKPDAVQSAVDESKQALAVAISALELKTFTVTCHIEDKEQTVTVQYGNQVNLTDPVVEHNEFDGWYTDAEYTEEYDVSKPVQSDITLYGKLIAKTYTATFVCDGAAPIKPDSVRWSEDAVFTRPTDPVKTDHPEQYEFDGWYQDAECTEKYDFSTPVNGDITLYGKFVVKTFTATFVCDGAENIEPDSVRWSEDAVFTRPEDPVKTDHPEHYEFDGWYQDAECTEKYDFSTPVNDDITLYGRFVANTYKATFVCEEAAPIEPGTVSWSEDAVFARPTDPVKTDDPEHYEFDTWYQDAECTEKYDFSTPVNGDITLYGKFVVKTFTATFVCDGAENIEPDSVRWSEDAVFTRPEDPVKTDHPEHYEFDGWYKDTECTEKYDFSRPVNGDITLYGRFVANTYTATFVCEGTDPIEVNSVTWSKDAKFTEPDTPVRTQDGAHYTFDGWYIDDKYTQKYDFDELVEGDITLYGRFVVNTYTATFVCDDTSPIQSQSVTWSKDAKFTEPDTPVRNEDNKYYTFDGWYTDDKYTQKYDFDEPVTGNITLHGRFVANTYTATFVCDDTSPIQSQSVTWSKDVKFTEPDTPVRNEDNKYYTFDGWYTDDKYTQKYDFDEPVTGNITLHGRFVANTYAATFVCDDTSPIQSQSVTWSKDAKFTEPDTPVRTQDGAHYTFDGWYTDDKYTQKYDFDELVEGDITLYGRFVVNTYTATFVCDDTSPIQSQSVTWSKDAKFTEPDTPVRNEDNKYYTFDGWYTDDKYTQKYDFDEPVTGNITLHGRFVANTYTATFVCEGTDPIEVNSVTWSKDAVFTRPADPVKTDYQKHYDFDGWYVDTQYTTKYDFSKPVEGDLTLFGKWIAHTYTLDFVSDPDEDHDEIDSQYVVWSAPEKFFDKPDDPVKKGYTFLGWSTDASGSGGFYDFNTPIENSMTLYAVWEENTLTVLLNDKNLQTAVTKANAIESTEIAQNSAEFSTALNKARDMLASLEANGFVSTPENNLTQESIDTLAIELNQAMLKLRHTPSRKLLEDLPNE